MLDLGVEARQEWVSVTTLREVKSGNLDFLLKNMKNLNVKTIKIINAKIITPYSKSDISFYEFKNMDLSTQT